MFSALKHLIVLGHKIETGAVEDNTTQEQYTSPKLNNRD